MSLVTVVVANPQIASQAVCLRILRQDKGIRAVTEALTESEIIEAAARLKPRILLLNDGLLSGNGVLLLSIIREKSPETKVIVVSHLDSEILMLKALLLGARGYLTIKDLPAFLAKSVRKVDAGEVWVPRKMVASIINFLTRFSPRGDRAFIRRRSNDILPNSCEVAV